jgi:hypothetical protein
MNYQKNYEDYIEYVRTLGRSLKDDVKYENHHILPKSMGGSDDKSNMVLLTLREHYLAHYLLWKIHNKVETRYAFWCMNTLHDHHFRICSRAYERLRKEKSKDLSEWNREFWTGKVQCEEANRKRSATLLKRYETQQHHRKGVRFKLTEEQIEKAKQVHLRPVICVETGQIYETIGLLRKELNWASSTVIRAHIRGNVSNIKGLHYLDYYEGMDVSTEFQKWKRIAYIMNEVKQ